MTHAKGSVCGDDDRRPHDATVQDRNASSSSVLCVCVAYLDCYLSGYWRWWDESCRSGQSLADDSVASRRSDLRKVLGCRQDLALGRYQVLLAARHHEDGLLAAHRRLDVSVRLGAQGFDLTT